jgi:hypothetical protein
MVPSAIYGYLVHSLQWRTKGWDFESPDWIRSTGNSVTTWQRSAYTPTRMGQQQVSPGKLKRSLLKLCSSWQLMPSNMIFDRGQGQRVLCRALYVSKDVGEVLKCPRLLFQIAMLVPSSLCTASCRKTLRSGWSQQPQTAAGELTEWNKAGNSKCSFWKDLQELAEREGFEPSIQVLARITV